MRGFRIGACVCAALCNFSFLVAPVSAQTKFSWGLYWRLRYEYWRNWKDMDSGLEDNRSHFPIKTSLWGKAEFSAESGLFAKITNECKAYTYFGGTASAVPDKAAQKKGYHFDINEVILENLYFEQRQFLGAPVDLKLGRQDFAEEYGEGFLIMEGTPQDGPRTLYFNAAKARLKVNEKNTVDFLWISNPRDEEYLPIINRSELTVVSDRSLDKQPQILNTTDEMAALIYWKNKFIKNLGLEAYYIFKYEAEEGGCGYQLQQGGINTLGSFIRYALDSCTLRVQLANQFGSYGDNDRRGIGGYAYLDKDIKDVVWSPKISAGFVYLSGDDKATVKNEGWDPLFSRWEWISPMYARSMAAETGILGYWTNMRAYRAHLYLTPAKKINLCFGYNFLQSNEQAVSSAILSGAGKNRGHLQQIKVEYFFNKNVTTFFWLEHFIPGNFYRDRDPAIFLRTELLCKF
jgi:hypothetical protein